MKRLVIITHVLVLGAITAPCGLASDRQPGVFVNSANGSIQRSRDSVLDDLDSDGDIDSFLIHSKGYSVWLNDDTGGQLQTHLLSDESVVRSVGLGDLDADGKTDVYVGFNGPDRILWGDGEGGFELDQQRLGEFITQSVGVFDSDEDGDLDVWLGRSGGDVLLINDGSGVLSDSGQTFGDGGRSDRIAIGDVNNDNLPDIVIGDRAGIQVWINRPGLEFDRRKLPEDIGGERVFLKDIDNDGDLDVWVGRRARGPGDDRIFWNDGSGNFRGGEKSLDGMALALGDFDDDGDIDALLGGRGAFRILQNDGEGRFSDSGQRIDSGDGSFAKSADLDGDGDLDVRVSDPRINRILLNGESPRIDSISIIGGHLVIEFVGTLISSDGAISGFQMVQRATSPYRTPATHEIQLFGVR